MFKSIGGFFRDIVAPIGLAFIPGAGPYLAAAYSGINTGIKTGSPLAGIGSAGLSLGLSSAFKGITEGATKPATALPVFQETGKELGTQALTEGTGSALRSSFVQPAFGGAAAREITKTGIGTIPATSTGFAGRVSNIGNIFDTDKLKAGFVDTTIKEQVPGAITDALPDFVTRQSPLTVAGAGLALKTVATPPPEPAPFVPMQPQRRTTDLSKYGYKGPLDRGEYTYADPEDIAYGRVTPDSYGYLGAKEGGKIKAQGGGVMMQQGPYNPQIEAQKGTFRPTGSMVPPTAGPSISRLAQTQPMMSMSPQKIRGLAQPVAPTVPTNMPMSSPTPMMPSQGPMLPQGGGGLAPQPTREPLPEIANNAQKLIDQLPQKDISVNIDSLRQFIGLAKGGEVKDDFNKMGIYQKPEDYNVEEMAEGGEVNSDKTLQENAFVIPADVVGHIGDGSSDAGAQRLQQFLGMNPQQYQAGGIMAGELQGPGGGMDDLIQTSIEGKRAAAVSPQEFVVPRDIVAELGQGSYDKGSNKLYALMRNVRKTKTGTTKQPAELTQGLGQLMRTAIG
jgi:hypothetical protein